MLRYNAQRDIVSVPLTTKKKSSFKIPFVCNDDLCLHCMCVVAETCAHIVFSDEFLFFYVLLLRGWYFHKQVKWMPTTANCIFIRTCLHNRNHQTCKQRRVEREKGGSTWSNRKQNILAHHIDNLCHVISHTWYSVQQAFEEEVLPHLPPPLPVFFHSIFILGFEAIVKLDGCHHSTSLNHRTKIVKVKLRIGTVEK